MDRWIKGKSIEKYLSSRIFTIIKYKKGKNYLTLTTSSKNQETRSYGKVELYGRTLFEGSKINAKKFLKDLIAKDDAYTIVHLLDNPQKIGAKNAIKHVGHISFIFLDKKGRKKGIQKLKDLGIKMSCIEVFDDKKSPDNRHILTVKYLKFLKK